jgi:phage terminase large subunit-like protein
MFDETVLLDEDLHDLQETLQMIYEEEARKGLDDLYFFDKYILGYKDMAPKTHRPLCTFISSEDKKKKHAEYPRGNFKSSVVTIGYTVQQVAKNPDIRVLIDNEVYGNSKAFLREIKGHLENPEVIARYPQLEPNKRINDGWTESTVIVKGRTKERKEPTISCAGLDQIKIGMHYDLIIMDDLVSTRNVTSKEQIDKVIAHYKMALSLLDPGGVLIIIGTRYHYSDLYGYLLDNEKDTFDHLILPAILGEEHVEQLRDKFPELYTKYDYKTGDLLFPERISEEFLQEQRTSQGTYIFNCNYMLDPVNPEESDLQKEWLMYYKGSIEQVNDKTFLKVEWVGDWRKNTVDWIKVPFKVPVRVTTTFDPANKKKKRSDFTGGSTIGVTPDGYWFILNLIRDKYNPKEIVDRIFKEYDTFKPEVTGIEEVGKETIKFYLLEQMRKLQKFFRLKELKTKGVAKEDRIKRLIPRFEQQTIFLPVSLVRKNWEGKTVDVVQAFEDEYSYFPLAKTDDILDALAYQEDMVARSKGKTDKGRRRGRSKIIA